MQYTLSSAVSLFVVSKKMRHECCSLWSALRCDNRSAANVAAVDFVAEHVFDVLNCTAKRQQRSAQKLRRSEICNAIRERRINTTTTTRKQPRECGPQISGIIYYEYVIADMIEWAYTIETTELVACLTSCAGGTVAEAHARTCSPERTLLYIYQNV